MFKRKLQVFISSTFLDLKAERQACVQAILKAGHIPAGMELFTAGDKSQLEVIKKWIDESDICVLILGGRYGTIETDSGLSYTELEYQYALKQGKAVFAIVQTDESIEKKSLNHENIKELENLDKLAAFKAQVTSKLCEFFDDLKDIRYIISHTIHTLEKERPFNGWISGAHVESIEVVNTKLNEARKENDALKIEIELNRNKQQLNKSKNLETQITYNGLTFEQLEKILRAKQITVPESITKTAERKTSALVLFEVFGNSLASGVDNAVTSNTLTNWLYHNLATYLYRFALVDINGGPNGAQWQRARLNASGARFLSEINRKMLDNENKIAVAAKKKKTTSKKKTTT